MVDRVERANMRHHAEFHCNRSNHCWDGDFSICPLWRLSAILDSLCACWDHPRRHLVVFITAKFDCSSFNDMNVFDFASLAWKCLFRPEKLRFCGIWSPKWGAISTKPQGTSLRESASFEPSCAKIRRRVWPVGLGEFPRRGIKIIT